MKRLRFEYHLLARHWSEKIQLWVAWHLPHWLVRWAVVRAYSKAWSDAGTKEPDELTYGEVYRGAETA